MRCNVNRLFNIIARSLFMIAGRGTFQDISTGEVNDKTQSGDCIEDASQMCTRNQILGS